MGVLTTTTEVPAAVRTYYDRVTLMRALPKLVYSRVATRRPIKQRQGDTMIFRKFNALPTATAPLVEGVPPTGRQLSKTDISVKIQQWGDFMPVTDLVQVTIDNPVLNEISKLLGEQAAQTVDELLRDVVVAGTSVGYGGGQTSRANLTTTTHKVDVTLLERALRTMQNTNATMFTQMVEASVKVSTFPIRESYIAITHPDVRFTIETLNGFISSEQYAQSGKLLPGEFGSYKGLRFLSTTKGKVFLGGGGSATGDVKSTGGLADVYTIMIFAEESCASVPLEGMSLENIVHPRGTGGSADPLNQKGTSGWKHTGARIRLQESFSLRLEVTAGDTAP